MRLLRIHAFPIIEMLLHLCITPHDVLYDRVQHLSDCRGIQLRRRLSSPLEIWLMVKTILIVDDSSLIRRVLSISLSKAGETLCVEAINGRDGIAKAQLIHPDLVILDLSMPEMNGLDAARELQRIMPAVPLVMFTTHVASELEREATRIGIRKVISKSDGANAVISSVRTLLAA